MERQKRVYPHRKAHRHMINGLLLFLAVLIFAEGIVRKGTGDGFILESIPEETPLPLEERFDETMTETVIELPAAVWYALQVGAFESKETAEQSALAFQKRGAAGYLWKDGSYRVLAAAYPEKADAQTVREQLRDQHGIDSYLYMISMPAYTLRIKGMKGQLEILQAAFGHINDIVREMQQVSVALDRQELSNGEMLSRLTALKEQMEVVMLRIRQRFVSPMPETVEALAQCIANYTQFAGSLSADESAVAMGMRLKYQVFAALEDIQMVYDTLSHT